MIVKLRHQNDGRHIRVHVFTSEHDDKTYSLLGMLAMTKDEWLVFRMVTVSGAAATGVKLLLEEDELIDEKKDGEIRISR